MTSATSTPCPSEEDLASFAGAGAAGGDVARHVTGCAACAEIVAVLRASPTTEDDLPARASPDEPGDPTPGETIGRYVILRRLGRGGMGVVVLAYDPMLDRTVALKLMRVDRASATATARLEREARSLARISHPNVVRVFDAGVWGGRVFLAMEHIEGDTLRSWLATAPRTTEDIVKVFVQVARGLAATHTAGFVHRDIKPDNILIGADRVPRLVDFGLVGWDRAADAAASGRPPTGADPELTRDAAIGTPGYMAPEQRAGDEVGPAADQFALCASLWEALFGARPFSDTAPSQLVEPAADREVPARLREAIARGLSPSPGDRWPSVDALVDALMRDAGTRARARIKRPVFVAAVAALTAIAVIRMWRSPTAAGDPCGAAVDRLAGVWDVQRAATLRGALLASGRPHAADTYERVAQELDRYTRTWMRARAGACNAAAEPRAACLDRQLREVDAVVRALSATDGDALDHAVQAVAALPPVEHCSDDAALRAIPPPPDHPDTRARIDRLGAAVATARALDLAGRCRDGLRVAATAVDEAERIGYAPATADALAARGELEGRCGDAAAAATTLERAALIAADARDDALAARAWAALVHVVAVPLARPADALLLRPAAEAWLRRAGSPFDVEARLWTSVATAHRALGHYDEARASYERALAILERNAAVDHPDVAAVLDALADTLLARGDPDEARAYRLRAQAAWQRALGPSHPLAAPTPQ